MPQLNPAPWFIILLLSWTTLLTMFKMKIMFLPPLNNPATPDQPALPPTPWDWPWI
uniref:ATP synthase complex subunit 8 n=1 Tax=Tropidophorus hainanus TaxID=338357 RepID=A0A977NUX0_9SAUR|nr:ATP synthase F0 subunit 8 [Tropidophorus hainanus]UVW82163.1 ATP synthase F0 subunit 8 [Tropidophorus hainanus]